jgi:predicted N-acetyltransferase YhbS
MTITIREATADDAGACGIVCHDAFEAIAGAHNFPKDFPSAEAATGLLGMLIANPRFYAVVAEQDGKIVGSNFLDERTTIAGLGPISVNPQVQNAGVGTRLMQAAMERADAKGFAGIRLVQAGYHCRSLSLYCKLGFEIREPLACLIGGPINQPLAGYDVREATEADMAACNELCRRVHGADRSGELRDALAQGVARVVVRDARITGYTSQIAFFGHTVAETTDDVKALIATAKEFPQPGFLVPSRNGELFRWCMAQDLRMIQPMTLMSTGFYNEPLGAWLPSILY